MVESRTEDRPQEGGGRELFIQGNWILCSNTPCHLCVAKPSVFCLQSDSLPVPPCAGTGDAWHRP